jgi:N-acetylneuraminate synthase
MQQLKKEFPDALVGLSDHTTSNNACLAAVALGAGILERHFTDHMNRPGPDIVCSMDENALRELLKGVKEVFESLGGEKGPVAEEKATIDFAFATVVTIAPIKKGQTLTKENVWVKRPGTGKILAADFEKLLGKVAARDLPSDTHLDWTDFQ